MDALECNDCFEENVFPKFTENGFWKMSYSR